MRSLAENRRKPDRTMKIMTSLGIDSSGTDFLSHLPLEIHLLILQNLDYLEFSRFNVVCKAWRSIASAARQSPFFRLQQVPWLIYGVSPGDLPTLSNHKMFYELDLFTLHDSFCFCGSFQGWLLLRHFRDHTNFLLNHTTGQRISLPENPNSILILGVILPHDHSADGMAVVAYFQDYGFYQWRSSHDKQYRWTKISGNHDLNSDICDMIYHKGNIYAVCQNSIDFNNIIIIDMGSDDRSHCCVRQVHPFPVNSLMPDLIHLVECNSDLLAVVRSQRYYKNKLATIKVKVFKYNPISIQSWEEVESIGEKYALLVGKGSSMAIDVSTTSTSFRGNCVFFLEGEGIRSFDLGDNRLGIFASFAWYARIMNNADLPTWFMPSLT